MPEIAIHVFPTLDVVHSYVGQRTQFLLCLLSSIGSGFTKITSDDWGPALANAAGCLGILVKLDCWLELTSDAVSAWSACLSAGLVSSEKMKEVAEMETARLKTEKVAKELLAAQTSQTSAAICKTTEQGPQHASIEKLLHDMLPAIGKDDPDYLDGSVIPAFFMELFVANLEAHILATVFNRSTGDCESGHDDIFLENPNAKKAQLRLSARPASSKIRLYLVGRVSMIPTKHSIFIGQALVSQE